MLDSRPQTEGKQEEKGRWHRGQVPTRREGMLQVYPTFKSYDTSKAIISL